MSRRYATPTRPILDELHATHRDSNPLPASDDLPRRRPLPGISSTRIAAAMTTNAIQRDLSSRLVAIPSGGTVVTTDTELQRELDARMLALAATHEEGHA